MPLPYGYSLFCKWYIANISVDAETASGLRVMGRDPRKWRFPPDAYSSVIDEVGFGCELVKQGSLATIERWRYLQLDIDDERICGSESHLLLVNGHVVSGNVVMKLIDDIGTKDPRLNVILPQTYNGAAAKKKKTYYVGEVIESAYSNPFDPSREFKKGDIAWIQKSDSSQWKLGEDKIVFRGDGDFVLMKGERVKVPEFHVV